MSNEQKTILEKEVEVLRNSISGDMIADMEIRDKIHNLEMQIKGVKPVDSKFECFGCGS